jgi:hypothetical protein
VSFCAHGCSAGLLHHGLDSEPPTRGQPVHDVFVSYARAERAKAEPIKKFLEAQGYKVFFDIEGLNAGNRFPTVLDNAVREAKALIGCWSPLAFTRDWVMDECGLAKDLGKLIPVAIIPFKRSLVPLEFRSLHYADLTNFNGSPNDEQWAMVQRQLDELVGPKVPKRARVESVEASFYIQTPEGKIAIRAGATLDLERADNHYLTFKRMEGLLNAPVHLLVGRCIRRLSGDFSVEEAQRNLATLFMISQLSPTEGDAFSVLWDAKGKVYATLAAKDQKTPVDRHLLGTVPR